MDAQFEYATLEEINKIIVAFNKEQDFMELLNIILTKMRDIANCEAGTLYVERENKLHFIIMHNEKFGTYQREAEITMPPIPLEEDPVENVSAYCAIHNTVINIADVYDNTTFNFSGPKNYDTMTGFDTRSMMVFPLPDLQGHVLGVIQLINARDHKNRIIPFDPNLEYIFRSISNIAASAFIRAEKARAADEAAKTVAEMERAIMKAEYTQLLIEEINKENEKSKELSHWYESLLDAVPYLISTQDMEKRFTYINKNIEKSFNIKRSEIIGERCNTLGLSICDTENCAINCVQRGRTRTYFTHDNNSYQVDTKVLKDLNGDPTGYIEIIQDITRMEHMAKQQAEAEAASHAKSSFLSVMSHEIRTPMNAIVGMTTIAKNTDDVERKNYAIDKIEEASTHMLGVINEILDMSKIEANKLELSENEFSFDAMLKKVMTVINFRVDEKLQNLTLHIDGNVPHFIVCDDQRLSQVIMNLLSNAVKFTPENGSIDLKVAMLKETRGKCELRIEVADSGIGITQEQQEKLFQAFSQADSSTTRKFGGTGLGLAISKQIVEMMGGRIWVESEYGIGARFIFTVQVKRGGGHIRSLLAPGVDWGGVRVLVAAVGQRTRGYLINLFDALGINCDAPAESAEARETIEKNSVYDIYFIDHHLPEINGIELAKTAGHHGKNQSSAVVTISSADWRGLKDAAPGSGSNRYLIKPLFSSSVIECINELMTRENDGREKTPEDDARGEFAGKKLLLAEDVEINREIVIALLEDTGVEIDCAENGAEAVEMIEANPYKYDLIFMDMQMPGIDGLEATRMIRALPLQRAATVPIVAMSANVFKSDIEDCLDAGMNDHIGKPLEISEVIIKMRRYLLQQQY